MSLPAGDEVTIADLIVPYRLDIIIRRRMVGALETVAEPSDRDLLDCAAETGYEAWFRYVEVARFRSRLADDDTARQAALVGRIRALMALVDSMRNAEDAWSERLVLDWHVRKASSESDIEDAYRLAPADGCHRIAIRSHRGHRVLEAHEYRRRPLLMSRVRDNTHRLVRSGSFRADEIIELFVHEHEDFRAAVDGERDRPRAQEFSDWIRMIEETA